MTNANIKNYSSNINRKREKRKESFWIFVFLLPCLIFIAAFSAFPIIVTVVTAFCDWDGVTTPAFTGLKNFYFTLFEDTDFRISIINTFKWIIIQLTVQTSLGLMAGFIMSREFTGWKCYRALLMIPNIVPSAALATMFFYIYNPDMGLLNALLDKIGLGALASNWLAYESSAFWAVTGSWIFYCGTVGVIFYSAIISVPQSERESALIDGCTKFQTDIYIVLPQLKGTIATNMILSTVTAVNMFDFIYMLTKGGPGNSTMSLAVLVYKTALSGNYGQAMSIGIIQAILGILAVGIINKALIKDAE